MASTASAARAERYGGTPEASPGYLSFAVNDRSGRRSVVVMLPTEPDQNLGPLLQLTVDTAICQMFGRVPPAAATTSPAIETTLRAIVSLRKDFLQVGSVWRW